MDENTDLEAIVPIDSASVTLEQSVSSSLSKLTSGKISDGLIELLLNVMVPGSITLLMIIVAYFVAKFVSSRVTSSVCKRVDQTIGKFVGRVVFYAILTIVSLTVLQTANIDVTGFAAVIAAAGFAIGLAFQGTLSNFSAGILLLAFRPFKVGDMVNVAGAMGKVNEIDLFTTTLDTPDNRRLIIPNSSIAGSTIENVSFHQHRRVDVTVGVAYSASQEQTREVLTSCAESVGEKLVTGPNRGFQVLLSSLGPSSVEWTVRAWVASSHFFSVREQLTGEIKRRLDLHGLEIPFPQMKLHLQPDQASMLSHAPATSQPSVPMPQIEQRTDRVKANRVRPRARGEQSLMRSEKTTNQEVE